MPNGQPHKQPNILFLPLFTVKCVFCFCEYCSVSNFDADSWLNALAPVTLACNVRRRSSDQTACWFAHTSSAGGWTHFSLTASPVTRIIHYGAEFIICVCASAHYSRATTTNATEICMFNAFPILTFSLCVPTGDAHTAVCCFIISRVTSPDILFPSCDMNMELMHVLRDIKH